MPMYCPAAPIWIWDDPEREIISGSLAILEFAVPLALTIAAIKLRIEDRRSLKTPSLLGLNETSNINVDLAEHAESNGRVFILSTGVAALAIVLCCFE